MDRFSHKDINYKQNLGGFSLMDHGRFAKLSCNIPSGVYLFTNCRGLLVNTLLPFIVLCVVN